jgi:hypothetical protein
MSDKSEAKVVLSPCASTESIHARQPGPDSTKMEHPQKISPLAGHTVTLNGTAPTGPQDLQQGSDVARENRRAVSPWGKVADTKVTRNNETRIEENCILETWLVSM